ncbi:hypothetical protein Pla110_20200 [Polystyrenella longa]|uniref:Uncharacterized protein n=1 Tax=Polystyrenella longa TaxID=2528007 RepID=A0A518CM73_9PLAN|nr:hypothetical protein [Polystyrenella longa]QDU80293.1 hypothetical protein Pla110_20200 [Polystyrenella longa]
MPAEAPINESAQPGRSKAYFLFAFWVTLIWLIGFSLLVLFTANPVTLNWQQLQRAQTVVEAEVIDKEQGLVQLKRFWKYDPQITAGEQFAVSNLPSSRVENGASYLIPLVLLEPGSGDVPDTYEIPLTQEQLIQLKMEQTEPEPIFYPYKEEAVVQLEQLLTENGDRAPPTN